MVLCLGVLSEILLVWCRSGLLEALAVQPGFAWADS